MVTELATINRTGFHISETPSDSSDSYTLPQIAELLNVNPSTVRHWVTLGRLPARKEGRRWVVDREYVEELMTARRSRRSSSRRSTSTGTTSAPYEPLGAAPEPREKRVGWSMADTIDRD
jgi:excisionase family DNA binding protein